MNLKTKIRFLIILIMKTGFFTSLLYETAVSQKNFYINEYKYTIIFLAAILFEYLYYNCKEIILKSK